VGTTANRDAIGARVAVLAAGRRVSGEVQSGSGFISQNDSRVHIGLGDATTYDAIEVRWPGGAKETFPGGKADQIVKLKQGTGKR
jgi:enediyne biosynthesis protein E4